MEIKKKQLPEKPNSQPRPPEPSNNKKQNQRFILGLILWVIVFAFVIALSLGAGALAGYQSARQNQRVNATQFIKTSVEEQYNLALQDLTSAQYEVAFQRLQFVIEHDPAFPGATDKMAEVMAVLYATATPSAPAPTSSPTPTRDLRPVEELFSHSQALLGESKWTEGIDTLVSLRKADPAYQTARVDGMLFISLRMRGFDKIWKSGDLNGGIYDLALASRFGPLDSQSLSARDLARLYLIGSSFWEVDPARAVEYFSQVAAAAPGLRDVSGITASARYREVLIQFGDKLMTSGDWCAAQQQYETAYSIGPDEALQAKTQEAALRCSPPTPTVGPTSELPTETPTVEGPPNATFPPELTPTATNPLPPPPTNTQPPATNTQPPAPPTNTPEPPTNTPEPPVEPNPTTPTG